MRRSRNSTGCPCSSGTSALAGALRPSPWQRAQAPTAPDAVSVVAISRPLCCGTWQAAEREGAVALCASSDGRRRRNATSAQTSSSCCCAAQVGMPVYLMPFLTIQNSSRSRHGRICVARSGGGGSMPLRDRTDRHARRAVTEGAAAMEMPGAERDEVGVVQWRRLDAVSVRLDRVAHREGQEPFHHWPVPAARRDRVEAGPDEEESEHRE